MGTRATSARSGQNVRTRLKEQAQHVFARMRGRFSNISRWGICVGLLLFALSLTPSLIPRHFVLQGILSGIVFAAGYGIGVALEWIWTYLGFSISNRRFAMILRRALLVCALTLAVIFLWLSTGWQNSIRAVMNMPPVESHQPIWVTAIALIPALVFIGIGTLIVHGVRFVARRLARMLPPRVALLGGIVIVALVSSTLVDGVLVRWFVNSADRFYAELDQLAGSYEEAPSDPLRSGSAASLIPWNTIGRDARVYVQSGPTAQEIETLTGRAAQDPLRVYVGLRSADTVEARAQLAFEEMLRVGAFDRSVLVLIMPVGTGWIDPPAIDTLEFLHDGDVASVALQYSYLTSWLSLVVEPDVGVAAAQALFKTVYAHWTGLPKDDRPKLYLHGLSLGAYSSQASAGIYEVLADPFHGAFWVGPPFASQGWRSISAGREPDSPFWLPRFGDGSVIRFASQGNALATDRTEWGPLRVLYLQYGSDPVVFFEPEMVFRPPHWLEGERAPDVTPLLHWYPVVTLFQVALDMALGQTSPVGYGHLYAPDDYLDGWITLTDPPGWDDEALARLRAKLVREGGRETVAGGWFRSSL